MRITKEYLQTHPNHIFVFGDNLQHTGHGGAASLRDEPNTYGFITKKKPTNDDDAFFTVEEYRDLFLAELNILMKEIHDNPTKIYLISKLGSGLANKHRIWENLLIENELKVLPQLYSNVQLLFEV